MSRSSWLLLLAAVVFGLLAWRFSFICDDSYIAFRYSKNLAEGHGACFNLGVSPPVEGYTQFGWILWIGMVEFLGGDPTIWSRVTTIACGLLLLLWVGRCLRQRYGTHLLATCAGLMVLASHPGFGTWATSGLETMAFALLLFATWNRLLGPSGRPHALAAGLAGSASVLMRADGLYWVGCLLALTWLTGLRLKRPELRRAALLAGTLVGLTVATHFLWRYSTYGDWLPQTARAKVGFSPASFMRGVNYVVSWFLTFPSSLLVLALGALHVLRGRTPHLGGVLAFATLCCIYPVLVGGDFLPFGRFLVPLLPFLALIAGSLVQHHLDAPKARPRLVTALLGLVIAAQLLPAFDMHLTPLSWREAFHFRFNSPTVITEWDKWWRVRHAGQTTARLGRALAQHIPSESSLVTGSLGGIGYYSGLYLYDLEGYVNREVTNSPRDPDQPLASPGHDMSVNAKFFTPWKPTYRLAYLTHRKRLKPGSSEKLVFDLKTADGFEPGEILVVVPFFAPYPRNP